MTLNSHHQQTGEAVLQAAAVLPFLTVMTLYIYAALLSRRQQRPWPAFRIVFMVLGVSCALFAMIGPLAARAHTDFRVHMLGHLLIGMLAPLLIVMSAPMSLFLRTLPVPIARRVTCIMKSRPIRILSDPIVASVLNIGGLWILYTTSLFTVMQQSSLLHLVIHLHVFAAGCLFTASIIYFEPMPHRRSFVYRAIVLIAALAGHGILSKYLYAYPPANVSRTEAETASMLMYYGGDAIDFFLIFVFCHQWFKAVRPRVSSPDVPFGGYLRK